MLFRSRQPLNTCQISNIKYQMTEKLLQLIKDELNVKNVTLVKGNGEMKVQLDTDLTPELVLEGDARELVRQIQILRKEKGCTIDERIRVTLPEKHRNLPEKMLSVIRTKTLADDIVWGNKMSISTG